jgi:hypothetical protein
MHDGHEPTLACRVNSAPKARRASSKVAVQAWGCRSRQASGVAPVSAPSPWSGGAMRKRSTSADTGVSPSCLPHTHTAERHMLLDTGLHRPSSKLR